jgi:hypothetical protein
VFTHLPIRRSLLTAVAVTAVALPAGAQARPFFDTPSDAQPVHAAPLMKVAQEPAANGSAGFQWDDAGIGAAGAIVLVGVGAGAATTIRRRRTNRVATA